jgi:hypothetical protein
MLGAFPWKTRIAAAKNPSWYLTCVNAAFLFGDGVTT